MPLLNTATKVYRGTALASKVYRGTVQVWPPAASWGPPQSAYTSQTPTSAPNSAVQCSGNDFVFTATGRVTGLRFYRPATAAATSKTLKMWKGPPPSGGTLMGTAVTTGDSGSGWKSALFPTPVAVTAGQTFRCVVVHAATDFLSRINSFTSDLVNGDVTMLKQSYTAGPGFENTYPTSTTGITFFIDVIFEKAL